MGFPVGYSELLLPTTLLRIALFLGYVRRLIFLAFDAVGLGDLLDIDDVPWPENSSSSQYNHQRHNQQLQSVPATLISREALPVVRYEELAETDDDSCTVCLCEFEHGAEVRRLSNCRHVFHRGCLDRWVETDRLTCPLCRTPLVQGEARGAVDGHLWPFAGALDSLYDEDFSFSSPTPNPTLILLDQIL